MLKLSVKWYALIVFSVLLHGSSALASAAPDTAANTAASAVLQRFGSQDAIRQNAEMPLTGGSTKLATIDGAKSASVQIGNPSSSVFLSISIDALPTDDISPLQISQDIDFDGAMDSSYQAPFPVSGICANGVISCDAGTWNHCRSYLWQADNNGRASLMTTTMDSLAGCYCVNQSCGGGSGNPQGMLKDLGGAVAGVVQGKKNGASVSRVELTDTKISYYGQNSSGSPTGTMAQSAYAANPAAMATDAKKEAATQSTAPDSSYSMLATSFAKKEATASDGNFTTFKAEADNRVKTITGSLDGNTTNQTTFSFTDVRQNPQTGNRITEPGKVDINKIAPPPDCEFVCKTRKPVQDSQVSLTGVSTDYQRTATRYDTLYHVCGANNTCPAEPGEVIVEDCRCLDEFTEAASAMMALDEASRDTTCTGGGTAKTGDCKGSIKLFNGQGKECLENGVSTSFFNCCNNTVGNFAIFEEHCPKASLETVQAKQSGRAHFIGTYCKRKVWLLGCVQRAQVYCVFNSRLGRIMQEQGRLQLESFAPTGKWGAATSPNCTGLLPEEFQMLDFSRLDLSEAFDDISPMPADRLRDKMGAVVVP